MDRRKRKVLGWLILGGIFLSLAPLGQLLPPESRAGPLATPTPTPIPIYTPPPIPWDDIRVDIPGQTAPFPSNESLVVVGQDVYVVYEVGVGSLLYLAHSTDGGHTFHYTLITGDVQSMALTRREGASPEDGNLYLAFQDSDRRILFTRSPDKGDTRMVPRVIYDGVPDDTWPILPKMEVWR